VLRNRLPFTQIQQDHAVPCFIDQDFRVELAVVILDEFLQIELLHSGPSRPVNSKPLYARNLRHNQSASYDMSRRIKLLMEVQWKPKRSQP